MGTYDTRGGTPRHDPSFDEEEPCAICLGYADADCICPECPVCGSVGDPVCYKEHGLEKSREQIEQAEKKMKAWKDEA